MTTQEICTKIVQCVGGVRTNDMFCDFTVKIGDESIKCHRIILAGCSEFFQALFRSRLREAADNSVVLHDITSEVFHMILNTLYSGEVVLTSENFIDIWRAVNMLQIMFLVDLCESYAIEAIAIETWENIYGTAIQLSSKRCLDQLHILMLKNFEEIRLSSTFLKMSFKEVKDLIKSQDLVVSKEDEVLDSVIKWVAYVPKMMINSLENDNHNLTNSNDEFNTESIPCVDENELKERGYDLLQDAAQILDFSENAKMQIEKMKPDNSLDIVITKKSSRKDKLTELLGEVRTCLVSPLFLSRVLKMDMISENKESREIIVDAMSYHVQDSRHGQWPSAAVHRSCSEYIHAGAYTNCLGHFLLIISADEEEIFTVKSCDYLYKKIQLATFDGELYATGTELNESNEACKMFVLSDDDWKEVIELPSHNVLLISHGDFIYIINKDDKIIYKVTPKSRDPKLEKMTDFPQNSDVKHAIILDSLLLLFCSGSHSDVVETVVHKCDMSTNVWTRLDNLDGPAEHLISFKNDKHNYILQASGSLWLVLNSTHDGNIQFKFLAKLWNFQKKLYGGFTYRGKLILFGNNPDSDPPLGEKLKELPLHFAEITHRGFDCCSLNFVPITLRKKILLPFEWPLKNC